MTSATPDARAVILCCPSCGLQYISHQGGQRLYAPEVGARVIVGAGTMATRCARCAGWIWLPEPATAKEEVR